MKKYIARKQLRHINNRLFKRTAYRENYRNRIVLTRGGVRL